MPPKLPACGFAVTAKCNGDAESVPLPQMKVKKVSKGKRITILSGVIGPRAKAVTTLRQLLGVGGEVSQEDHTAIELQGDQTKRIPIVLKNIGACIITDNQSSNSKPATIKVERTNYDYDKFMKKSSASIISATVNAESMSDACILVHGKFWPYCNGQCQYCPPLTDVFEGLEMYCSWFDGYRDHSLDGDKNFVNDEMTTSEILSSLSALGMRAEVGEAVRLYESDKRKFIEKQIQTTSRQAQPPERKQSVVVPQPRPVVRPKPAKTLNPHAPVRVIMNHLYDEDEEWFVLKISMVNRSLWISDYEEFIRSLIDGSELIVAQMELVDSRTLKIRFWTRNDRDACQTLLSESMESMLEFTSTDAVVETSFVDEMIGSESEEEEETSSFEFQRMAEELGLESNDEFWEMFCNLIDISDGSTEGVARAFNEAVLRVLSSDDSPHS